MQIAFILSLIIAGAITIALSIYASKKRKTIGAPPYVLLMLSVTLYTWAYAFELSNSTLDGIYLALKIEYFGAATIAAFWLIFAIEYSRFKLKRRKLVYASLFIIPLTTIIMLWTNNYHHLHYTELSVSHEGPFPVAKIVKGPWYLIDIAYKNLLIFIGNALFLRMVIKTKGALKKQAAIIFLASLIPWFGHILYQSGFGAPGIDLTPFFLATTGPLYAIALFHFKLFDIIHIARDQIFEGMYDPIIVTDVNQRIVDFNTAATAIFQSLDKQSVGKSVKIILKDHPKLIEQFFSKEFASIEFELNTKNETMHFVSSRTDISDIKNNTIGIIATLHNITAQKELLDKLHNFATTDELTGLANRRYFLNKGIAELCRMHRFNRSLSIILLDLDYFKKINDTHGHQAGDLVLTQTANVIKESLRTHDIPSRYGGEEFAIILPETDLEGAQVIAERIRQNIESMDVQYNQKKIPVTTSTGISYIHFEDSDRPKDYEKILDSIFSQADKALYQAKENGRNRIEVFDI